MGVDLRLRVLQVGKYYPPCVGGMESHLEALVQGSRPYVDTRVIVANQCARDSIETAGGVEVVRAGRVCTVARAPLCPTMAWHIARTEADVVHLHLPNPGAVIAYLASGHRGKLVLTEHGEVLGRPVLRRAFQPFMAAALRRAEAVIATSAEYIAQSSVLSAAPEKCRVIPLGIRTDTYARVEPAKVAEIQARYPGPAFLAIGRLVRFKGFEYAVRALAFAPGLLLIAGDGPLMAPLREIARSCGVADRVHLLGSIANHELVPYLHAADVLVMPSIEKRESFGIVQLEAMACSKPVINTRLASGVPFVSLHGVTGLTVPPADVAALAKAMRMLASEPDLRARLGAAGRARVTSEFTAQAMVMRTFDLYREVAIRHQPMGAETGRREACSSGLATPIGIRGMTG